MPKISRDPIVRFLFTLGVFFLLAAGPLRAFAVQGCAVDLDAAVSALHRAGALNQLDLAERQDGAGWIMSQGELYLWSLGSRSLSRVSPADHGYVILNAARVTKASGRTLFVVDVGHKDRPELAEVLAVPGARAFAGRGAFDPDTWDLELREDGTWAPRSPREFDFAKPPAVGVPLLGSTFDQKVIAWNTPGRPYWHLTSREGEPRGFGTGEAIELEDGRRVMKDHRGRVFVAPAGLGRILAVQTKNQDLRTYFKRMHTWFDQNLTSLPPIADLADASLDLAYGEDVYIALIAAPHDGEHEVLLEPMKRPATLLAAPAGGPAPLIRLSRGATVYARGGRWYTRGGASDVAAPVDGTPNSPGPNAAAALAE